MISSQFKIIMQPSRSTEQSQSFGISGDITNISIYCFGLQGAEVATLYAYDPISQTYKEALPLQQLSATQNNINLTDIHGSFVINKSTTLDLVGVSICGSTLPPIGGAL